MNKKKNTPPETEEEVFNAFLELFDLIAPEIEIEVDDILRENGYDPVQLAAQAESVFNEALKNSPLDWRNRARQEIDTKKAMMAQSQSKPKGTRSEIIAAIQAIQQKRGLAVSAHFRNLDLEKISDTDLNEILADLEYLESEDGATSSEEE